MGLFRRKDKVVDLTEQFRKQQEKIAQMKEESEQNTSQGGFDFLSGLASGAQNNQSNSEYVNVSADSNDSEEKRRKLSKRLLDMTQKIEDMSNQIYHLQQRIELLERKMGVN